MAEPVIEAMQMFDSFSHRFSGPLNEREIGYLRSLIVLAFREGIVDGAQAVQKMCSYETAASNG